MSRAHKRRKIERRTSGQLALSRSQHKGRISRFLLSPDAPRIMSAYFRVTCHAVVVLMMSLFIVMAVRTSIREIDVRIAEKVQALEEEKAACEHQYITNHCGSSSSPYLQQYCDQWKQCMNRETQDITRAKIATLVYGELLNGFIEPLTFKSMMVICLLIFGSFILSSFAL